MFNFLNAMGSTLPDATYTSSDSMTFLAFLAVYFLIFGLIYGFLLVYFVLKAFAVFKMSKTLNLPIPWLGFIPYVLPFAYGRIAEQYNKNIFKKPIKFSVVLTVLQFAPSIALTVIFPFYFLILFLGIILTAVLGNLILGFIFIVLAYLFFLSAMFAVTIFVNLFNCLACWNVLCIFAGEKHVLYFILTLALGIEPIMLFILRNKQPQNLKKTEVAEVVVEN